MNSETVPPDEALVTEGFPCGATADNCFFCGFRRHPRAKCPAKDALCKNCQKKGHYAKVCRSSSRKGSTLTSSTTPGPNLATVTTASAPSCLTPAVINVTVNSVDLHALVDTGSAESYVSPAIAKKHRWKIFNSISTVNMASSNLTKTTKGHCFAELKYKGRVYSKVKLSLLPDLCADLILGHDFLGRHKSLELTFTGEQPPLSVCGLSPAKVVSPPLFAHLSPDCKPIATKSRKRRFADEQFIGQEVARLLKDGIIEPSNSPWRAQVLVTTNERQKKRMVVDYSQTVNRFTQLDAYPLPRIDSMTDKIASYEYFSTLDLKSAYHQVPILESEKEYTAFEAGGNLYQFTRIPFGVTNGVACFQRVIDSFIKDKDLSGTFAYVDNVTICGMTKEEHDINLEKFLQTAKDFGFTFNQDKTVIAVPEVSLLGYSISKGVIRPDPERFRALKELPPPSNLAAQRRVVGMFSYYSPWIENFSKKIINLSSNTEFPIPESVKQSFCTLKEELESSFLITVDPAIPLTVETDASESTIAATLNQEGRPVAFFSRTLNASERNHSAVEKEAYAIVEAIKKWRHYLLGTHFKLVTDQRSVAFIYDNQQRGKVKNEKIQRWKLELSCFSYDVKYRPGPENVGADALSRAYCSSLTGNLQDLHNNLCHPGVARMYHFVRSRNLPFSMDEVKQVTSRCRVCSQIKPTFYKPPKVPLIKATQPFERLSIDFKGPLPSMSSSKYLLTIIDEYSRFPFAFPCADMSTSTVIKCLTQLFSIFGMPSYVHSDRGTSFMSQELQTFLQEKGIGSSRTTAYNPRGNGQVEKLNDTLWKTVQLALQTQQLPINKWELVLADALHSIRSLLCTSTNATPHERLFTYARRSTSGSSLPSWLLAPGRVLMKKHARASKYDPLVEEVELLQCNPQYAHVRQQDGRETTVALRHLAPAGDAHLSPSETQCDDPPSEVSTDHNDVSSGPAESSFAQENNSHGEIDIGTPSSPQKVFESETEVLAKPKSNIRRQQYYRTRPYELRNREA